MSAVEWERTGSVAAPYYRVTLPAVEITLEARPTYCDRGKWIAKLHVRDPQECFVDSADGWPRYYFNLGRARLEVEAWIRRRELLPEESP